MKHTNCLRCSKSFKTKRISRKYCSDICRQYAYLNRKGFVFANNNSIAGTEKIEILEQEGMELYQEIIVNDTKGVIVNDNKLTVNDSKSIISNNSSVIVSDIKNITVNENITVNDNKNIIVNEDTVNESKNIAVNEEVTVNEDVTVNDSNKVTVNNKLVTVNENATLVEKVSLIKSSWLPYKKSFMKDLEDLYKEEYEWESFSKDHFRDWDNMDWWQVGICNSQLYESLHKLLYYDRIAEAISLTELEELHENIYYLQFGFFLTLPEDYIYFQFIKELEKTTSQWIEYCKSNQIKNVPFKLNPALKLHVLCILRQMKPPPDQDYYELNLSQNRH